MGLQKQIRELKERLRLEEEFRYAVMKEGDHIKKNYSTEAMEEIVKQNNDYFKEICELKTMLK